MIIKEIEMENIRSYDHTIIRFPRGTILFEGDIGSGKTSILMAIEFALFGNSTSDFYKKLLRKGKTHGSVRVKFEVNGEDYEIYRSLVKKGRGIANDDSYVITPDGKIPLTSTDIRAYVLRLMGLDVRTRKRKSLPVVTYAIYTPQETMKSILEGRDEERLEVIRKIFKLDEYRIARDNTDIVISSLKEEARVAETLREELGKMIEESENLNEEITVRNQELEELQKTFSMLTEECEKRKKELEALESKRNRFHELKGEIEKTHALLSSVSAQRERRTEELKEIERAIEEMKSIEKDAREYENIKSRVEELMAHLKKLENLEKSRERLLERKQSLEKGIEKKTLLVSRRAECERMMSELQKNLNDLGDIESLREKIEEESREIYALLRTMEKKLAEKKKEKSDLNSLGAVCPTCKRPLTEEHKLKLIKESEEEIKKIEGEIGELKRKLHAVEYKRKRLQEREREARKIELKIESLRGEMRNLDDKLKEIEDMERELKDVFSKIEDVNSEISSLGSLREEYERSSSKMKNLEGKWRRYIALKGNASRYEEIKRLVEELRGKEKELKTKLEELEMEFSRVDYSEEEYMKSRKECEALNSEIAAKREAIKRLNIEIERLMDNQNRVKERISEIKNRIEKSEKMLEMKTWLSEKFKPALEDIEKMRLAAINEEFRMMFEEWFNDLLGESEYSATIDENFRPVIRYEQYDMPISTLSGGERTSVALAYRLALNTMVKRALGLESNLLILDEPTDGFSKDQLYKLKDILDRMDTDQIIIVSHEKELRNLADVIFRVEKKNGKSIVRELQ